MTEPYEKWLTELLEISDTDEKMTSKKMNILKAAIDTFSEKGYASSSTSEIAKKAGVAEGTIFRHYKTKKELLLSIVAPTMSKLVAPFLLKDIHRLLDAPFASFEEFLRELIRNRLTFARKHIAVIKIMAHEIPFQPELKEQFIKQVASQVYERMNAVVAHYHNLSHFSDMPVEKIIRFTASTLAGYLIIRFLFLDGPDWDDEQEIEELARYIIYGLAGPQA